MAQLDFDEETGQHLSNLYDAGDLAERRHQVREALDPSPGERLLSLGPGPGHEPAELAKEAGEECPIVCVDHSPTMLEMARERCQAFDWVSFQEGGATDLPLEDGSIDGAVIVQVYEYVDAIEEALDELHRVLAPGGRAVIVDSEWSTLAWHASDEDRARRVLDAFENHCERPYLARYLPGYLRQAGFEIEALEPVPQVNLSLNPDSYSWAILDLVEDSVTQWGIDEEEVSAWAEDVRETDEDGTYFFSLMQVLFQVRR